MIPKGTVHAMIIVGQGADIKEEKPVLFNVIAVEIKHNRHSYQAIHHYFFNRILFYISVW